MKKSTIVRELYSVKKIKDEEARLELSHLFHIVV